MVHSNGNNHPRMKHRQITRAFLNLLASLLVPTALYAQATYTQVPPLIASQVVGGSDGSLYAVSNYGFVNRHEGNGWGLPYPGRVQQIALLELFKEDTTTPQTQILLAIGLDGYLYRRDATDYVSDWTSVDKTIKVSQIASGRFYESSDPTFRTELGVPVVVGIGSDGFTYKRTLETGDSWFPLDYATSNRFHAKELALSSGDGPFVYPAFNPTVVGIGADDKLYTIPLIIGLTWMPTGNSSQVKHIAVGHRLVKESDPRLGILPEPALYAIGLDDQVWEDRLNFDFPPLSAPQFTLVATGQVKALSVYLKNTTPGLAVIGEDNRVYTRDAAAVDPW